MPAGAFIVRLDGDRIEATREQVVAVLLGDQGGIQASARSTPISAGRP